MAFVSRFEIEPLDSVLHRVQNPQSATTGSISTVDFPIRVHRRIPLIRRDQVVNEGLRSSPIPLGHDDVALDTGWPRRSGRNFSRSYAGAPIGEDLLYGSFAEEIEFLMHRL